MGEVDARGSAPLPPLPSSLKGGGGPPPRGGGGGGGGDDRGGGADLPEMERVRRREGEASEAGLAEPWRAEAVGNLRGAGWRTGVLGSAPSSPTSCRSADSDCTRPTMHFWRPLALSSPTRYPPGLCAGGGSGGGGSR